CHRGGRLWTRWEVGSADRLWARYRQQEWSLCLPDAVAQSVSQKPGFLRGDGGVHGECEQAGVVIAQQVCPQGRAVAAVDVLFAVAAPPAPARWAGKK